MGSVGKSNMIPRVKSSSRSYPADHKANDVGAGTHISQYSPHLLQHIENQKLKPRSPYYEINQGDKDDFFSYTDPTLPPHTADTLEYDDLPDGKWIRILKLEPGLVYQELKCTLVPIDLDDHQHENYEALSYTWGAYYDDPLVQAKSLGDLQRVPNPIVCNGVWEKVTPSLAHALFHFRQSDRPRYLWVDALCINQKKATEVDVQISLMQRIYQQAKEVLVWVGWRSDNEVEHAMNLLCYLANQECGIEQKHGEKAIWYDDRTPRETSRISGRPSSAESWYSDDHPADTAVVPLIPTSLAPLVPLFEACYFRRLWVFQEVALSPRAAIFWGKARIAFEWVALVASLIAEKHTAEFAAYDSAFAGLQMCAKMHYAWRGVYAKMSFFDLLVETRDLKATQGQDKIWGLLGIKTRDSDPAGNLFLDPESGLEKEEVFERVARKVLLQQGDLRCLAAVETGDYEEEDYKMKGARPSWVPNFARKQATFLPALGFRAHGDTHTRVTNSGCSKPHCIIVEGFEVDTISSIIDLSVPTKSHWRSFAKLEKTQRVVDDLLKTDSETNIAICLTAGISTNMQDRVPSLSEHAKALRMFRQWRQVTDEKENAMLPPPESASEESHIAFKFFQASAKVTFKRCLFKTKSGLLAAGPENASAGDAIIVLLGGQVPFVMRRDDKHYRLIGQSYVNGLMEGQAIEACRDSGQLAKNIHLV